MNYGRGGLIPCTGNYVHGRRTAGLFSSCQFVRGVRTVQLLRGPQSRRHNPFLRMRGGLCLSATSDKVVTFDTWGCALGLITQALCVFC